MSQTTQIISAVCLIDMLLKLAEKHTQNQDRLNLDGTFFSFSFYPGWMRLMFTCVLGR